MHKISFVEHNGTRRDVQAEDGLSLMEVAVANLIPGIDADCGGACACATCHIHIDQSWLARLQPMADLERSMLELAAGGNANSRLACQIRLSAQLDGLVVHTPLGQH